MKNIMRIFTDDLKHIRYNVIALIMVLGISIIPSLYAWFNIAASWDPYGNTENLKIAVANADEGYQGDFLPMEINVGEKIVGALRENEDMDWVFTSEKKAVEGTRSGEYYAAIVITEDFSKDMLSLFSEEETKPVIRYYSNEKENAIAPKVTDIAANTVQQQIDEVFAKTSYEVILSVFDDFSTALEEGDADAFLKELNTRLNTMEGTLSSSADTIDAFAGLTESLQGVMDATSAMFSQTDQAEEKSSEKISDAAGDVEDIAASIDTVSDRISGVLSDGVSAYSTVKTQIGDSFSDMSSDRESISKELNGMADQVQTLIDRYEEWKADLEDLSDALPAGETLIRGSIQRVITKLDSVIGKQQALHDKLTRADELLSDISTDISTYQAELDDAVAQCQESITAVQTEFDTSLKTDLGDLADMLSAAGTDAEKIQSAIDQTMQDSDTLLTTADGTLDQIYKTLTDSAGEIRNASEQLGTWSDEIKRAVDSDDVRALEGLLTNDPELLASLWASPVNVDTNLVYEVANTGSSMAPYYLAMSIWVGGVIMVAMMKVRVSDEKVRELSENGKVRHAELYFGRFLIFLLLGLIQTTIVCLGCLYFLQIQCLHPLLFMLAGWVSSFIFVFISYTLTLSFGNAGKAAAVILLVIQVAGSGGSFPIEVAPDVYQKLYPLLPFVHTMDAMRESIAGMYQNTYWLEIRNLLLYLIPVLILGLILRRPIIKMNRYIEEKVEEVKFM